MKIVFHFYKHRGQFDKFLFQFLTELYNYLVSNSKRKLIESLLEDLRKDRPLFFFNKKNQELIYLGVACCNIHRLFNAFPPHPSSADFEGPSNLKIYL